MTIEAFWSKLQEVFQLVMLALFVFPAAYWVASLSSLVYPPVIVWIMGAGVESCFVLLLVSSLKQPGTKGRRLSGVSALAVVGCALAYAAVNLALPYLNLSSWQQWLLALMEGLPSPVLAFIHLVWLVERNQPQRPATKLQY
jgi:hypothetical protein